MRVALVHDDLIQWGGAERMLVALSEIFPDAPIYTTVFDENNKFIYKKLKGKKIVTSFLQKIPDKKTFYKTLFPLHPIIFENFDFSGFDLVISQTTRFAKAIITKPETVHLCYCHTPPRFLWKFSGEKVNPILEPYFKFLRFYDRTSSSRVDHFLAGSQNAQQRIKTIYQRDSRVIYPFVDLERFQSIQSFDGGYLLVVSRLNRYKRVDIVIETASKLGLPLKIVGKGPEEEYLKNLASDKIDFYQMVDEETLSWLIAGCKALIIAAEEDFGLTALEAQALGKPVIAYGKGGVLETVVEGETGYFFAQQSSESLKEALQKLDKKGYNEKKCKEQAVKFSKEVFIKNFQKVVNSL